MEMAMDITGRKLFVKALLEEGVDTVFGYPTAGTLLFNSPGSAVRDFSSAKPVFAHLSSPG